MEVGWSYIEMTLLLRGFDSEKMSSVDAQGSWKGHHTKENLPLYITYLIDNIVGSYQWCEVTIYEVKKSCNKENRNKENTRVKNRPIDYTKYADAK